MTELRHNTPLAVQKGGHLSLPISPFSVEDTINRNNSFLIVDPVENPINPCTQAIIRSSTKAL